MTAQDGGENAVNVDGMVGNDTGSGASAFDTEAYARSGGERTGEGEGDRRFTPAAIVTDVSSAVLRVLLPLLLLLGCIGGAFYLLSLLM